MLLHSKCYLDLLFSELDIHHICLLVSLFERSEFLIDISQRKNMSVCVCVRLILVLVLCRQTVYGQKTVYLCLSTYIVFENTHAHSNVRVTTAASETEGVAAVSRMETHMILSLIHI